MDRLLSRSHENTTPTPAAMDGHAMRTWKLESLLSVDWGHGGVSPFPSRPTQLAVVSRDRGPGRQWQSLVIMADGGVMNLAEYMPDVARWVSRGGD